MEQLRSIIRAGSSKAKSFTCAHILLMASEGETDAMIADRLRVNSAVNNVTVQLSLNNKRELQ